KMCVVSLVVLLFIITISPLAHAQGLGLIVRPILGPIPFVGPILGQPAPRIVPPVGQVPPVGLGQLPIVGSILGPIVGPILSPILGQPIVPPVV
ncbi:hypothetical protein, partial [Klebsiella aerogenes]|uniref:hypothetical protein n=1 Tax=Klebsiella aerogenes TaxID=548 RepID=UPI001C6EB43E